ncbi:hypothetical protein D3C87_1399560 [compost metagenome]
MPFHREEKDRPREPNHSTTATRRLHRAQRRGTDFRHRQLRRYLRSGVPGCAACAAQCGTNGLLGLVREHRRRPDRRLVELPLPRADHHRVVYTRGRVPCNGDALHPVWRSDRGLCRFCHRLHLSGVVRRLRAPGAADPRRDRCRPARRHPAAIRHQRVRWRQHRPDAGGRAGFDLRRAAALHHSICRSRHPSYRHGTAHRAGQDRYERHSPEPGSAGLRDAPLLGGLPTGGSTAAFRHHADRAVHAGHAGAAQRRLQDQRQPDRHSHGPGLARHGPVRRARLQRGGYHRCHLHRQGRA